MSAKYDRGVSVIFHAPFLKEEKTGEVTAVNSLWLLKENKGVTYDIFVSDENRLYKDISEKEIVRKL